MDSIELIRNDFPMIKNHKNLIYFDNAATSLKPQCVIDSISEYYSEYSVNAQRGSYDLGFALDEKIEQCRNHVASFINSKSKDEIVFTTGTTQGLNQAIEGYLKNILTPGDIVLTTKAEHASLLLPLMRVCDEKKAVIKYIQLSDNGTFDVDDFKKLLNKKVKAIVISYVSNVLGFKNPLKEITDLSHEFNAIVIVDGAQSTPHMKIDVQKLGCDIYCFSTHKMCGPTGLGVMYGKKEVLNKMQPLLLGGGSNVNYYSNNQYFMKNVPYKFESGTLPLAEICAFDVTLTYLEKIGMENINEYETQLRKYLVEKMEGLDDFEIYNREAESGILTFNLKGVYGEDLGKWFNNHDIAIRTGQHCTRLLIDRFLTDSTSRISLYFYNTFDEIDRFIELCKKTNKNSIYDFIFNG